MRKLILENTLCQVRLNSILNKRQLEDLVDRRSLRLIYVEAIFD